MIINRTTGRAAVVDRAGNIVEIALVKSMSVDNRRETYDVANKKHAADLKSGAIRFATDADLKSAADAEAKRAAKEKADAEKAVAAAVKAQDAADKAKQAEGGPLAK